MLVTKNIVQPVKNVLRIYDNIWKVVTCQNNDNTTSFLIDYNYLKSYCNMIAIVLSEQQTLDIQKQYSNNVSCYWSYSEIIVKWFCFNIISIQKDSI